MFLAVCLFAACGAPTPVPCGANFVDASLSSATLANDCPNASPAAKDAAGICLSDPCPSLCRQTSIQLAFVSHDSMAATIEILAVRLVDPATGKVLDTLKSREPQRWSGEQYVAWDQQLAPGAALKATYKLSAPTYASDANSRLYEKTYRVEVDVSIDGGVRTLTVDAQREPEVVT